MPGLTPFKIFALSVQPTGEFSLQQPQQDRIGISINFARGEKKVSVDFPMNDSEVRGAPILIDIS